LKIFDEKSGVCAGGVHVVVGGVQPSTLFKVM